MPTWQQSLFGAGNIGGPARKVSLAILRPRASFTSGKDHHFPAGDKGKHPSFHNPAMPGPVVRAPGTLRFRHLLDAAVRVGEYTNNLRNVAEKIAIITRAVMEPDFDRRFPSAKEVKAARNLMFMAAAPASRAALDKGHLRSLGAFKVWRRGLGERQDVPG